MTGGKLAHAQSHDVHEQVGVGDELGGASEDDGIHVVSGKREV
jgi:hypothetical protein